MNRRRPVIAAAICVVVLLSIFISSAYIAHEAAHSHNCVGKDCPVCQFIAQIEQVRRGFGMALPALFLICLTLAARRDGGALATADVPAPLTPVEKKTRLNN